MTHHFDLPKPFGSIIHYGVHQKSSLIYFFLTFWIKPQKTFFIPTFGVKELRTYYYYIFWVWSFDVSHAHDISKIIIHESIQSKPNNIRPSIEIFLSFKPYYIWLAGFLSNKDYLIWRFSKLLVPNKQLRVCLIIICISRTVLYRYYSIKTYCSSINIYLNIYLHISYTGIR